MTTSSSARKVEGDPKAEGTIVRGGVCGVLGRAWVDERSPARMLETAL